MSEIWVCVEHGGGSLTRNSREALNEGRNLADASASELIAVLVGSDLDAVAAESASYGADESLVVRSDVPSLADVRLACDALEPLLRDRQPIVVLFPGTLRYNELAASLAARMGCGLVSDCNLLEMGDKGKLLATRFSYGGKVSASFRFSSSGPQFATLSPGVTEIKKTPRPLRTTVYEAPTVESSSLVRIGILEADPNTVDLSEAEVIVSGGRGVDSDGGFAMIRDLAAVIKASVGGTRVPVDSGRIPFERQVGQTGKTVAPRFFLSVGASGAIHYANGFREAEYVLALDKDPRAPVFEVADVGVVGDANEVVPLLIELVHGGYEPSPPGQAGG